MARDESPDFAVHLHMPRDALEPMPPAMVRLHVFDTETEANPLADSLRHLLNCGFPGLRAARPGWIVEQGQFRAAPLLDVG
jgi:hypothetical protein